ncbi:hypothetical protein ACIQUQ_26055 [Streptomyces sp. NPDC101118]|uniref:hypothetical protein n=1 Tax=Streptomyces sp. NPDC101118 TaxID=3366109 RepID=UPI00380AD362
MTHPLAFADAFRDRSGRRQAWGLGLLSLAFLSWLWLAYRLFVPYEAVYDREDVECPARVALDRTDLGPGPAEACRLQRDTTELLGVLVVSLPFAVTGTVLYTSGGTAVRLSAHLMELERLKDVARRR